MAHLHADAWQCHAEDDLAAALRRCVVDAHYMHFLFCS